MNLTTGADILLVLCPPWGVDNPPLGPAYLASNIKKCGLSALIYDINLHLNRWVDKAGRELWRLENDWQWRKADRVDAFLRDWEGKIDEMVKEIVRSPAGIIGFTVVDPNELFTAGIIRRVREKSPDKTVIAGGPACLSTGQRRFLLDSSDQGIDYFVAGEGEDSLSELLLSLKTGKTVKNIPGVAHTAVDLDPYEMPVRPDLGSIRYPDYQEFDLSAYDRETIALIWSRGCVGNCLFCKERSLWGNYRTRNVSSIVEELVWHQDHTGFSNFVVYDSAVNGNPSHLEEICDAIIRSPLDIKWSAEAIPLPTLTRSRLHKMRAAGCHTLVFGVESGSDTVLRAMNKPFGSQNARKVLKDASYAGIKVAVNILVGFPGEGEDEFGQTLRFLAESAEIIDRIDAISNLQVVDGTPLEKASERLGIIFPDEEASNSWYTDDGNDLELRLDRVKRVRELAGELRMEVGRTAISSVPDKAPLKFRTRPVQLLRTLGRSILNPSGFAQYSADLARKKFRRKLGEEGIVSEISAGDGPILEGIEDGSTAFSAPAIVYLDLTNRCNLSCIACWDRSPLLQKESQASGHLNDDLPLETVTRFIDDLVAMGGVREIRLGGGGEPTMHPEFARIVRYIKSRPWNVHLEINTNFTRIDQELAEGLVSAEVDSVMASLWAGDGETYERTHPGQTAESFKKVVEGMRHLSAARGSGKPELKIHNVLMNLNFREVPKMVDLALDIGIDEVGFVLVDPVPGSTDTLLLARDEMARLGEILADMASNVDRFGTFRNPGNSKTVRITNFSDLLRRCHEPEADKGSYDRQMVNSIPCYIGWLFVRIMADGSVVPCCKGHRMVMGNILEDSFARIWGSDTYAQFRTNALTCAKSDPYFSLMGSGITGDIGCGNCDNLVHNLVWHRKVMSRSGLIRWVKFEARQKRLRIK